MYKNTSIPLRYLSQKYICLFFVCLLQPSLHAQLPELPDAGQQQAEAFTESNGGTETEDDNHLQQWQHYLRHPLDLNMADEVQLQELAALNPLQINNLLAYRRLLGPLVSVYELQAVPGWDVPTILRIRPYVTIGRSVPLVSSLRQRFKGGNHSLLLRAGQVLGGNDADRYSGSPLKLLMRYRYAYKNLLQYGLLGEKDAGEPFLKGRQRMGFDFYSAHLFVRNLGLVRSLALGDFTVNVGQGLVQWQSLAFSKGPDACNIKRQSAVLRPYHASGEANFYRGVGLVLGRKHWQATVFVSYKKNDANKVADSLFPGGAYVSSLQTSGYHRTPAELADKGVLRQWDWGGQLAWRRNGLHLGINWVGHRLGLPLVKTGQPYNLFALGGQKTGNASIEYSYTFKNAHFFGELASSGAGGRAFVGGVMASVAAQVDIALLYRNLGRAYRALYASAFAESAVPGNERGWYMGITIRPTAAWRLDAFADLYRFGWLRFGMDAPGHGSDFLLQATYRPNKEWELYTRLRMRARPGNATGAGDVMAQVAAKPRQNWRTQVQYRLNRGLTLRSRAEVLWYDKNGQGAGQGFLVFADLSYHPLMQPFSAACRLQYFETDGYDTRLYAYENDVLYSFSIPVFYNRGWRWYLNLHRGLGKKLGLWLRMAQTVDKGGPGVPFGRKTEVKCQLIYQF
jgi:hypothetical protein